MTDPKTVRLVVILLGATVLLALGAVTYLLSNDKDVVVVVGFGTTALGALGGILSQSKTGADPNIGEAMDQIATHAGEAAAVSKELEVHQFFSDLDDTPAPAKKVAARKR